jgi:hypothetical protein
MNERCSSFGMRHGALRKSVLGENHEVKESSLLDFVFQFEELE